MELPVPWLAYIALMELVAKLAQQVECLWRCRLLCLLQLLTQGLDIILPCYRLDKRQHAIRPMPHVLPHGKRPILEAELLRVRIATIRQSRFPIFGHIQLAPYTAGIATDQETKAKRRLEKAIVEVDAFLWSRIIAIRKIFISIIHGSRIINFLFRFWLRFLCIIRFR